MNVFARVRSDCVVVVPWMGGAVWAEAAVASAKLSRLAQRHAKEILIAYIRTLSSAFVDHVIASMLRQVKSRERVGYQWALFVGGGKNNLPVQMPDCQSG